MQKTDIDEVVLVGGSTRIPKIRQLVEDFFGKQKKLNVNLNPDEAIAHGAAVQAGILSGVAEKNLLLLDVAPLSLGIETDNVFMNVIIARNSPVPTTQKREFATAVRNAKATMIKVYEGERKMVKDNNLLGQFELTGFPPGFHIAHDVEFALDQNGILTVSATIKESGKSESLTITNEKGRLSASDLARLMKEAEDFKEDDEKRHTQQKALVDLKNKIADVEHELNGDTGDGAKVKGKKDKMESEEVQKVQDALADVRKWIEDNKDAEPTEINEKKTEFDGICSPLLSKHTADTIDSEDDDDADLAEEDDLDADLVEEDL
jgi:molecular chaperone DnaK (HSP70)